MPGLYEWPLMPESPVELTLLDYYKDNVGASARFQPPQDIELLTSHSREAVRSGQDSMIILNNHNWKENFNKSRLLTSEAFKM